MEPRQSIEYQTFVESVNMDAISLNGVTRVLIGGLDNAGKSTLACSLHRSLEDMGVTSAIYELDRWSDTHEVILGQKSADQRQKNANVTFEQYRTHADLFLNDVASVVIGDLEGRYQSEYIPMLKNQADFGVLVTRDPIEKDINTAWLQTEAGWRQLFEELEVPIRYHVHSIHDGQSAPNGVDAIRGLNRELMPDNPGVIKLTEFVIKQAMIKNI